MIIVKNLSNNSSNNNTLDNIYSQILNSNEDKVEMFLETDKEEINIVYYGIEYKIVKK